MLIASMRAILLTTFDLDENKQKKSPLITNNGKNQVGLGGPITLELRFRNPTLIIYCILDSLTGLWRSSPISLCIFNKLNPFSVVL